MQLLPSGRVGSMANISIKRGKEKTVTWNQTLQGDEARGVRRIQETGRGAVRTQTREGNFLHKMSAMCCSKDGCPSSGVRRLASGVWVTSGSSVVWWLRATGFYERGRGPGV